MIPLLCALVAGPSRPAPQPRLGVVIPVDQLRPDYLDRYRPQLRSGLAMLLKQGAVFTEAYHDHAITETAPGHATILSGRWPAHTGIIRNLAGVQDSAAPLIGVTGIGASPTRFRGPELFAWLKVAEPTPRALPASGADRGGRARARGGSGGGRCREASGGPSRRRGRCRFRGSPAGPSCRSAAPKSRS